VGRGRGKGVGSAYSLIYKSSSTVLSLLALGPLFLFFAAITYDWWGVGQNVQIYSQNATNPTFEMFLTSP